MKAAHARRLLAFLCMGLIMHAAVADVREEAVTLVTPTVKLAGTLQLPAFGDRVPVALIISGSGPTDRDGNSAGLPGPNNSLKMLAEALANAGVASLRYDKRGIAASTSAAAAESELRFDMYVDDAAAWVDKLKSDRRFSSVLVIGHSEGSLIGMLAAQRAQAGAFISIAGPAQSASAILRKQLAGKLTPELAVENEHILASLERGTPAGIVPVALGSLYRLGVQPYLISWFKYVPAERISALKMPLLIAQGTTDIQVGVEEAQALKAASPDAVLAIIPGMNHVLKLVPADMQKQVASYSDPALPIAPQLVAEIMNFIRDVSRREPPSDR